jgi:putative flippase GtrA
VADSLVLPNPEPSGEDAVAHQPWKWAVNDVETDSASAARDFTVVVPTRHESENVGPLLDRLQSVLAGRRIEVLFVDDSDDDTPSAIRSAAAGRNLPVGLLHREVADRRGGLSGAVVAGLLAARAPWVIVMDGDLQHPPEVLTSFLEQAVSGSDLVVASRYLSDGSAEGLAGAGRALVSRMSNAVVAAIFPRSLRTVTDPMSGFFAVRVEAVDISSLRPQGYKILLEIITRSPGLRISEIPFVFGQRTAGDSKASLREGLQFVHQMMSARLTAGKRSAAMARMGGFLAVGLTGIAVNTAALDALTRYSQMRYQIASVIATQLAIVWNFVLIDRFVLLGAAHPTRQRLLRFWVLNNALLPLQLVLLTGGVELLGLGYAAANIATLVLVFLLRYAASARWVFPSSSPDVIDLRDRPAVPAVPTVPAVPAVPLWRRGTTRTLVLLLFVAAAYFKAIEHLQLDGDRRSWFLLAATLPVPIVLLFRGPRRGGEIEDHQIDVIVALILLGSALLMVLRWRGEGHDLGADTALTSLPVFAAGATCLLYGVGAIWRARLPLAISLLAATPIASVVVGPRSSTVQLLIVMVAVGGLGLIPLITVPPAIRPLNGPVIGAAPVVSTSVLMLLAAGGLAAALWQAPAFTTSVGTSIGSTGTQLHGSTTP